MQTLKIITEPPFQANTFIKRIGSTNYEVRVYFNQDAKETIDDKILRLMKTDLNLEPVNATIMMPQTSRLPERGFL